MLPIVLNSSYRFEKFLIFIWKGRGAQIPMSDATLRRLPDRKQCRTNAKVYEKNNYGSERAKQSRSFHALSALIYNILDVT